ncbi:DNA mismatch repair protein MutL [Dehalobacter sp. UNSWDHB]|uniref:DNA mismatch repair endonuclease MutL n=1 Tax=unclassified Dehalobacter TaxID=2635733 RepID=UPI00028BA41C|nr:MULTISPECIES: DNA mismatch repair endonuclease MutL [unclassified Dehalobacter]AFV01633.1 DNA mismatch repair protein MutL [Dehalobacter sp. DCA]AFV04669.1 DNA mismatch repair protein MutL [Dehalobacter sp. CF]EQB21973.1 DNA mismatch repair protein MutL [Dehalobacter sp. UNSWDHB]
MAARIKLLEEHCINQIAAGEVVERPLSVVKELVENALDAGARKIDISIEGGGTALIRVKDDGAGILAEDLRLAVLPHATSKISAITDLDDLRTLGFRGEALPSIASVSKLSIMTRTPDDVAGQELKVEGGTFLSMTEIGCPPGTVVTVKDLFYNTPARHKFLRSAVTEFGWISDMVGRLSLARPDVAFSLRHPNNILLHTPGNGSLIEAIAAVSGNDAARKMLPISYQDESLEIFGYVSMPEHVRSSRSGLTFFVNGRVIRSQLMNQAIKDGYHTLIPANTYPVCVISLNLPPSDYDVNVHPAKLEIKFKEEKELSRKITEVIQKNLLDSFPMRKYSFTGKTRASESAPSESSPSHWEQLKILYRPLEPNRSDQSSPAYDSDIPIIPKTQSFRDVEKIKEHHYPYLKEQLSEPQSDQTDYISDRLSGGIPESIPDRVPERTPDTISDRNPEIASDRDRGRITDNISKIFPDEMTEVSHTSQQDKETVSKFLELKAVGQVFHMYILAADDKNLYIIDQHAAHERIRYESLLRLAKRSEAASQLLLIPETVELTVQEEQILLAHFDELHGMGFIFEHFGDRTYFLRGVPLLENLESPGKMFKAFIDEILNTSFSPSLEKLLEEWIMMLACRSAVKGKERLMVQEMDEIIQKLGRADNPYSCPHGRPTIIQISEKELNHKFERE